MCIWSKNPCQLLAANSSIPLGGRFLAKITISLSFRYLSVFPRFQSAVFPLIRTRMVTWARTRFGNWGRLRDLLWYYRLHSIKWNLASTRLAMISTKWNLLCKRMFWANGQSWNMFVTETSRAVPWTQLCSWRGCRLCLGMKKLFQSDHTLLDCAKLAVLVKTFPNRNSPTELSTPARLSTQVFAQCVTPPMSRTLASTLSLISFPSRVKINKLLDIPAILYPSPVLCV